METNSINDNTTTSVKTDLNYRSIMFIVYERQRNCVDVFRTYTEALNYVINRIDALEASYENTFRKYVDYPNNRIHSYDIKATKPEAPERKGSIIVTERVKAYDTSDKELANIAETSKVAARRDFRIIKWNGPILNK